MKKLNANINGNKKLVNTDKIRYMIFQFIRHTLKKSLKRKKIHLNVNVLIVLIV